MPVISKFGADWTIATFIEQAFGFSLYGFYAATVLMSVALLVHKGLHNSRARLGLFIVTIVMFTLSTVYVCWCSKYYFLWFPTLTSDEEEYNPPDVVRETRHIQVALMILRRIDYFISDAVVVWRTWCIWYDNRWVRLYLAFVLLATAATSIAVGVLFGKIDGMTSNMLGTFCLLVTNFSTTILCGYKVWHYRRFIKSAYGGRTRKTMVENVLLILVESGSLYCIFWLLFLLGDYGYLSTGPLGPRFGLEYFMPHFSGIYVSMIIVVVALSKSSTETFFSVIDRDMQNQFPPGADGLDVIQFAPPKSTLMLETATSEGITMSGSLSVLNLDRRESDTTDVESISRAQNSAV